MEFFTGVISNVKKEASIITFNIDDKLFKILGDFTFEDGDKIALCTKDTNKDCYDVLSFANYSKDIYSIEMIEKKDEFSNSDIAFVAAVATLTFVAGVLVLGLVLALILAVLALIGQSLRIRKKIQAAKNHNEQVRFFEESKKELEDKS